MLDALTRNLYLIPHLVSLSKTLIYSEIKVCNRFFLFPPFFVKFLSSQSPKILMYSEPIYVMIVNKQAVLCTTFLLLLFCISGSNKNVIYCFCIFSASWHYCYLSLFILEITKILNRFTDLYKLSWDSGILLDFSFFLNFRLKMVRFGPPLG